MRTLLALTLIGSSWLLSVTKSQSIVVFTLSDNTLASTTIGNIRSKVNNLPEFQNSAGYYQVILSDFTVQSMATFFKVNRQTDLQTDKDLDRDAVCLILSCCHLALCDVTFRAVITSAENETPRLISIKIQLTDTNDLAPKFAKIENIILPESTAVNQEFPLPEASDGESAENSVQSYTLEETSSTFGLITKGTRPYLKLIQKLDYEMLTNYKLIYKAADKLFTATATISVIVTDVNDNSPTFAQITQTITVVENQQIGEPILQITATDMDSGENGRVTYTLDIVDPTSMTSYFQIVPSTGQLQLVKALDYENGAIAKNTQLLIVARDAGQPQQSATATVSVILEDANDNPPVVTVIVTKKLREESKSSQLVAILGVRDADKQALNRMSCDLVPRSTNFQLERQIDADGTGLLYMVFSIVPINYEFTQTIQLIVDCTDGFNNALQTLTITIEEINEFIPTFDKLQYSTSISENTLVGSKILELRATDDDKGLAGTIVYSITKPNNFQYFRVNNITGDVFVKNVLNREDTSFISFTVTVTDFPGRVDQQFNSSVLVNISLLDVNDEVPSYIGQATLQIPENRPTGYKITNLMFKDKDAGNNGSIERLFLPKNVLDNNNFKVDADNFLLTDAPVDRELKSQYYVQIVAVDGGVPSLSGSVTLQIDVDDANDNAPQLLSPIANEVVQFGLNTSMKMNTFVIRLLSVDNDKVDTLNSQVQYTLLPSNGSSIFRLNKTSGIITTAWGVDSNSGALPHLGIYELRVRLQDRAEFNQMENISTFYVRLVAPNEDYLFGVEGSINGMLILILIVTATVVISIILLWLIWRTRQAGRFRNSSANSLAGESSFKQHPDPSAILGLGSNTPGSPLIDYNSLCGIEEKHYSTSLPIRSANYISTSRGEPAYVQQTDAIIAMDHVQSGRFAHVYHPTNNVNRPLAIVNGQATMDDCTPNSTLRQQRVLLPQEAADLGRSSVQSFAELEADSGRGGSSEDLRSYCHSNELNCRRFNTFQPPLRAAYATHHYQQSAASAVPPPVLPSASFLTLKEQTVTVAGTSARNDGGATFI